MMKILTKNVKTVLLSVLCLVMLVSTFVATMLVTNKANAAVDENTQVWVDDFESFEVGQSLTNGQPYTVNANLPIIVADPANADNKVLQFVNGGQSLIEYSFASNGYSTFKDGGTLIHSVDYFLSEEEAQKTHALTMYFYNGVSRMQVNPYRFTKEHKLDIGIGNATINTGIELPIGEWFTIVLRIANFGTSQCLLITNDGITCVNYKFNAIRTDRINYFYQNGITSFRIGAAYGDEQANWLVDNISFKYDLDSSNLSMQTTDGEVGTATEDGWNFTAEKGKTRTMEVTGLTATQSVVGMYNNQLNTPGEYDVLAVIKDTAATNPYSDTIYYWKKVNVIGQTIDMSGVSFESASFDYDGQPHKIEITGNLPEGVEVSYENNEQTEVGEYTAVAKFTVDTTIYAPIPDMTAKLTIAKADSVVEVTVDKTSVWEGDVITSKGLNIYGEESQSEVSIQWYRKGQTETAIEGATGKTYTVTAADFSYLLKVVYTEGTLQTASSEIMVNRTLEETFESYPEGTVIRASDTKYPLQSNGDVALVADPKDSENQVAKLDGMKGQLLQTAKYNVGQLTHGLGAFKEGFVLSVSYYIDEESDKEGQAFVFLYNEEKKFTQLYNLTNGKIKVRAGNKNIEVGDYPRGEWFTITVQMAPNFEFADTFITYANGETKNLYAHYGAIDYDKAASFAADGLRYFRVGTSQLTSTTEAPVWLVDNITIKSLPDMSALSMQASTGEAGTATDLGWDYAYTGTERTMEVTGTTGTQSVVQFENDVTNAGRHDIFAVIKDSAADTRKYSDTVYYWRRINVSKASYNMEGITFENATYDWEHDKTYNIVIGGDLPQGVTVQYTCNGEPFTGTTAGGVYEITATFVVEDTTNYNVPAAMTATLTVNQRSYDMSNVTFEGKTVTYNGEAQTIAVSDNLPDGVTAKYYIGEDEFTGATNAGTYTVVAKFTGSIDYMPIADMTATLVIEKANYNIAGVTFVDKTATYNGTAVEFVASNLPAGVTAKYYVNEDEVTEFINAGEYNVTVKFESSDANYNAPTQTKTAKLTINKADVDMSGITFEDKTVYFDGLVQTLEITGTLPSCVSVEYKVNGETFNGTMEEGEFEVTAVFTLTSNNYNALTVTSLTATLKVEKRSYDMSGISFESASFVYDGQVKSLAITGTLPEGVEVNYVGNDNVTAGEYTVTARFVGDSTYADIPDMTATLTITKATIDMSGVTFADASVEYDGQVHSITISGTLPQGVSVTYEGNAKSEVGEYTVTAKFALDDTANYNAIADMTAKLTITEKASSAGCMSSVTASAGVAALITMFGAAALIRKGKKD